MKNQLIIIGLAYLLIIIGFSGCIQEDSTSEVIPLDESKIQAQPPTTESIQTILEKTEKIESMYYEIAADITMPQFGTQTATIKIWKEHPYIKEEITSSAQGFTETITVIQRPEGTYFYNSIQEKYTLTNDDVSSISTSLQYFDNDLIMEYINEQDLTDFESVTFDGKKATILQYSPDVDGNLISIELWIWNEKGVPLKAIIDMDLEEFSMGMEFIFRNYSFSDIPDSVFSIS